MHHLGWGTLEVGGPPGVQAQPTQELGSLEAIQEDGSGDSGSPDPSVLSPDQRTDPRCRPHG